mmetsp:Transcript_46929/g.73274  ORF Transcript_46929/g.73274 Transcript_46929/m.73274 type:complete len:442 (+) Transcript_46929:49-1374(+)
MPSPGPFLPFAGLQLIHEDTGKLEPLLGDGDIRGSLEPACDEIYSPRSREGECCMQRSDHRRGGDIKLWSDAALATTSASIPSRRRLEAASAARGASRDFVRDFVNRQSVDASKVAHLKVRIGAALDSALSSGLLSRTIDANAGRSEVSHLQSAIAVALDRALRTREFSGAVAMVAAEQDIHADPPIPSEPPASSIFEDCAWKDPPPAPAWLSRSLSASKSCGERKIKTSASQLDWNEANHVYLHIYDFSEWTRIPGVPLHHVGVEVYRCEYYFSNTGVGICSPGANSLYLYREAISLGQTSLSRKEWRLALVDLRAEWSSGAYARLGSNCQDFVLAVCDILGVSDRVPSAYRRFAEFGEFIHETHSGASDMVNQAFRNLAPSETCKPRMCEYEDLHQKPQKSFLRSWLCGRPCSNIEMPHESYAAERIVSTIDEKVVYII